MYTYVMHKDPHETSIAVVVAVERVIETLFGLTIKLRYPMTPGDAEITKPITFGWILNLFDSDRNLGAYPLEDNA
jgi:hypothetical protein